MLNQNELKQKLINTGYFIDNEYLDKYLDLIYNHEVDSTHYSENHHVIPVALYKLNNDGCSRRKAEKFAKVDLDNFEVLLLYKDHCLAHYLLYFCTNGKLKAKVSMSKWTEYAKKHATKSGLLKKGTRITFDDFVTVGDETWVHLKSGWMCAEHGSHIYLK